jgi:hypothetical protein
MQVSLTEHSRGLSTWPNSCDTSEKNSSLRSLYRLIKERKEDGERKTSREREKEEERDKE